MTLGRVDCRDFVRAERNRRGNDEVGDRADVSAARKTVSLCGATVVGWGEGSPKSRAVPQAPPARPRQSSAGTGFPSSFPYRHDNIQTALLGRGVKAEWPEPNESSQGGVRLIPV